MSRKRPRTGSTRARAGATPGGVGGAAGAPAPASAARTGHAGARSLSARGRDLLLCVLLATSVLVAYAGVRQHDFVNFDDPEYVVQNRHVTSGLTGENLVWALTAVHSANWHPLTWISHMVDGELYGLKPGGHHLTSVLLHALATVLLFLALRALTGAPLRSAFVAGLFALHPRNVESVAWVSERKDVLSAVFWTGAMWAYAGYARRTTLARYLVVTLLLVLGLLAKPMVVTLPAALLLLDVWPLGRLRVGDLGADDRDAGRAAAAARPAPWPGIVLEKLPLLAIALAAAAITFVAQRSSGAVATLEALPLAYRLQNAAVTYAAYLWSLAWPTGLAVFYPYRVPLPAAAVAASVLVLVAITALAWWTRRARPYVAIGWLWYLGTLVPVIGIVKAGDQAMADRFTYLPAIGVFVALAWTIADAAGRHTPARRTLVPAAIVVLLACGLATRAQVTVWRDSVTLFEHALGVTARNHVAHLNLAAALVERGDAAAAVEHAMAAAALRPDDPKVLATLGTALARGGRPDEARAAYRRGLQIDPDSVLAHLGLAVLAAEQGRWDDARQAYAEVLRRDPAHAKAHAGLGFVLASEGRPVDAIPAYRTALALDPALLQAYNGLALALEADGAPDEALRVLERALQAAPDEARLRFNYAAMLLARGRAADAEDQYRVLLRARPQDVAARVALADLLLQGGRNGEARDELGRAAAAARASGDATALREIEARSAATGAPDAGP